MSNNQNLKNAHTDADRVERVGDRLGRVERGGVAPLVNLRPPASHDPDQASARAGHHHMDFDRTKHRPHAR